MIEVRPCVQEDAADVSALLGELGYEVSPEAAADTFYREMGFEPNSLRFRKPLDRRC